MKKILSLLSAFLLVSSNFAFAQTNLDKITSDVHAIKAAEVTSNRNAIMYATGGGAILMGILAAGAYHLDRITMIGTSSEVSYVAELATNPAFRFLVQKVGSNAVFNIATLSEITVYGATIASVALTGVTAYFAMTTPASAATLDDLAKEMTTSKGFNQYLREDEGFMIELARRNPLLQRQVSELAEQIRN